MINKRLSLLSRQSLSLQKPGAIHFRSKILLLHLSSSQNDKNSQNFARSAGQACNIHELRPSFRPLFILHIRLTEFVNLNILTNFTISISIANQPTPRHSFTIVKHNSLSWRNGFVEVLAKSLLPCHFLTCTVTLESKTMKLSCTF